MTRRIVAVTAGLSVPSSTRLLTDQITEAVQAQVTSRGEALHVDVVEVRELAGELAAYMTSGGLPTPRLSEIRELVSAADGLIALEPAWITSNQIEASRVAMTRYIKRGGKVWIKIFPDKPVTEKPAGTRMGSGKGSPEYWVAVVKPGRVLFELADVDEATAREALRLASHKLPVRCKFVKREELDTVKEGDAE